MDDNALKEDVNSEDECIIIEGKATSEPSEQQVHNEVQGDEEAAMPNVTRDEQNLNVTKELKKRKQMLKLLSHLLLRNIHPGFAQGRRYLHSRWWT